jgi:hypothetical protein
MQPSDLHAVVFKYLLSSGYNKTLKRFLLDINKTETELQTDEDLITIYNDYKETKNNREVYSTFIAVY